MGGGPERLVERTIHGEHHPEAEARNLRGRVFQVLHNVVENAVRYARDATTIDINVRRIPSGVRVEVSDHGEEIPPDVVPFIFERFVRADRSRGRNSGGAGIGLAIVRELVAAHGGQVGAESNDGVVTIWFELPGDDQLPAAPRRRAAVDHADRMRSAQPS